MRLHEDTGQDCGQEHVRHRQTSHLVDLILEEILSSEVMGQTNPCIQLSVELFYLLIGLAARVLCILV